MNSSEKYFYCFYSKSNIQQPTDPRNFWGILRLCQDLKIDGNQRNIKELSRFCKLFGIYEGSIGEVIDLIKNNDADIRITSRPAPKKGDKKLIAAESQSSLTSMTNQFQYDLDNDHFYIHPCHLNQPVTCVYFENEN